MTQMTGWLGAPRPARGMTGPPWLALVVALLALLASAVPLPAQEITEEDVLDAMEEPGDELLLFEDIPVVVSASRQATPMNLSSVPISVVSADDIHYGGQTRLSDILTFVPGVDSLQIDRIRRAVGVRGLHDFTSDRTLTLVDGRNANSPLFGGSEFYRLPILVEDIERIEVVRGPGGAAWGANAFNGVINVIMKKPEDTEGALASVTINEFGDIYSQLRWGTRVGHWAWRLSAGYEDLESSEDALTGENFTSDDWIRGARLDAQLARTVEGSGRFSAGLGYSYQEAGKYEFVFFPTPLNPSTRDSDYRTFRGHARWDFEDLGDADGYFQWFSNYGDTDEVASTKYWTLENDLEAQMNWTVAERHQLAVGGNLRLINFDADVTGSQDVQVPGGPFDEQWLGVFFLDRWDLSDHLTLEGQARVDWYSETQTDWSGRLTGLWAFDDQKRNVVRFSAAKAFRAPLAGLSETITQRVPLPPPAPPGLFGANVLEAQGLQNEEIYALEAGYNGRLDDHLTLRADVYYQRYNRIIGSVVLPDPLFLGRSFFTVDNLDGADAWGSELELSATHERGKLSVWYAYNAFEEDNRVTSTRALLPSRHKAGINARLFLGWESTANLNYRYSTTTDNSPEAIASPTPAFNRVDLTIARELLDGNGEILLGVSDLFDETEETTSASGSFVGHDTPGRIFFLRAQLSF